MSQRKIQPQTKDDPEYLKFRMPIQDCLHSHLTTFWYKNGGDGIMQYRIQLDTKNQLFVAIDAHDQNHFGTGRTIEQAIHQLKATNKAA